VEKNFYKKNLEEKENSVVKNVRKNVRKNQIYLCQDCHMAISINEIFS